MWVVAGTVLAAVGCAAPPVRENTSGYGIGHDRAQTLLGWARNAAMHAATLPADEVASRVRLADLLLEEGAYREAIPHLEVVARAQPGSWVVQEHRARVALFARNDAHEAIEAADRCLQILSGMARCHQVRALALYDLQRYDEAVLAIDAAWQLDHSLLSLAEQVMRIRLAAGAPDRALAVLPDALSVQPRSVPIWMLAAQSYERSGDLPAAEAALLQAAAYHGDPQFGARTLLVFYRRVGWHDHADALQARMRARP